MTAGAGDERRQEKLALQHAWSDIAPVRDEHELELPCSVLECQWPRLHGKHRGRVGCSATQESHVDAVTAHAVSRRAVVYQRESPAIASYIHPVQRWPVAAGKV